MSFRIIMKRVCVFITSEGFCSCKASSRMRTHEAIDVVVISSEAVQQAGCKSALAVVVVYNKLSDPAYCFVVDFPPTRKCILCQAIVD